MEVWLSGVPVDVTEWLCAEWHRQVPGSELHMSFELPPVAEGWVLKRHNYMTIDDIAKVPLKTFLAVNSDKDWDRGSASRGMGLRHLGVIWANAKRYRPGEPLKQILPLPGGTLDHTWFQKTLKRPIEEITKIEFLEGVTSVSSTLLSGPQWNTEYPSQGPLLLESVGFPTSLEEIPGFLCQKCYALKGVKVAEGTKVIGPGAFNRCGSLESVRLPRTLERLGVIEAESRQVHYGPFFACDSLVNIIVYAKIVGVYAFHYCDALETITFSEGLVRLCDNALADSDALERVLLPKSTEVIGIKCFERCDSLKSVTILSEGKLDIMAGAFMECNELRSIDIRATQLKVYENAFHGCAKLRQVNARMESAQFIMDEDELFDNEVGWGQLENIRFVSFQDEDARDRVFPYATVGWTERFRDEAAELASIKVMMRKGLPGNTMRKILDLNKHSGMSNTASEESNRTARMTMVGVTRPKPYSDRTHLKRDADGTNPATKRRK